jgi:Mono-functional DNA-alkylating methyl methanesulfonate N-term
MMNIFQIIQVTPIAARLIHCENKQMISEWKPPDDRYIGVVSCNSSQLVCASACDVFYIEILEGQLVQKWYDRNSKVFLEHVFKKCALLESFLCPSVRLFPIFSPFLQLES